MSSIKIFVGCHKPALLLQNNLFEPILLGSTTRDNKVKEFFKDCSMDNYGDNISDKNSKYSELTGLYNIWKNPDYYTSSVDYVGFMHYRRVLDFGCVFSKIKFACYSKTIKKYINKNSPDIIVPQKSLIFSKWIKQDNELHDLKISESNIAEITKEKNISTMQHYNAVHIKEDFESMLMAIKSLYPEIYETAEKSVNKQEAYFFNMFIAKKEIFNNMMSFVFSVLDFVSKQRNDWNGKEYNHPYQKRVAGFIAERLTSIYIDYLYSKNTYNIVEKKMLMVDKESSKLIYKLFGFLK